MDTLAPDKYEHSMPAMKNTTVPTVRSLSTRAIVLQACGIWLVTRLLFVVFTYMAVLLAANHTPVHSFTPEALLRTWDQWDVNFFLAIGYYGYYSPVPTVYFPLYPLLTHLLASIVGFRYQLEVAILISNLGTLTTFIGLGLLVAHEEGTETVAKNAIRVAASYPLAFYLAAPYSEGVFLALATWMLVFMRRRAWYRAAACAFIAGFTRPTAVILILPLIWEYGCYHGWWLWLYNNWRVWQWQPRAWYKGFRHSWNAYRCSVTILQAIIVVEAVPLAFAFYALYCQIRFGIPWAFVQSEQIYWLHRPMPPWQAIRVIGTAYSSIPAWTYNQALFLIDLFPLTLFALLTLLTIRRMPFSFTLYMLGLLQLCIVAPVINPNFPFMLMSISRFLVVSIPIFLLLGRWIERHTWLDMLVVGGSFMLQGLLTAYYLQGGWIA